MNYMNDLFKNVTFHFVLNKVLIHISQIIYTLKLTFKLILANRTQFSIKHFILFFY